MADNKIKVEILTPERPLAEEEATEVNFPADGQDQRFMVNGGFAQVAPDRVTLMANEAQAADDIDRAQAEADLKQSEADLLKAELPEEVDAALDLAKTAETRINLS